MQDPAIRKNLLVLGPAVSFVGGFLAGPPDPVSQFGNGLIAVVIYAILVSLGAVIVPAWRTKSNGRLLALAAAVLAIVTVFAAVRLLARHQRSRYNIKENHTVRIEESANNSDQSVAATVNTPK